VVNVTVTSGGTSGPRGASWLSGAGVPSASTGFDGDFYLDTTNVGFYYGPKTSGAWGTPHAFGNSLNGVPLYNVTATTDPGVSNDTTQGYSRGSIWVNTTANRSFICTAATIGAAVWTQTLPANLVASGTPAYGQVLAANSATTASWQITPGFMADTGVLSGGNFTINGANPAAFDLVQTVGYVADYTTNPASPTITKVTLPAQTVVISGANLTREINWWVADANGVISSVGSNVPTEIQRRSLILLGSTASVVGTGVILAVVPAPTQITQPHNQFLDFMYNLGPFSTSGNLISPNGTNLSFNKTVGTGIFTNFQSATVPSDPHNLVSPAETPATFRRATQVSGTESGALVTTLDPANYDLNGVITPVGGGSGSATIQRIWLFGTGAPAIQLIAQYGQTVYGSLSAAQAAVGTTSYVINPDFIGIGVLLGWVCVTRSATNLSDPTQATFIQAGKFVKP
jgi:hypothetical protein